MLSVTIVPNSANINVWVRHTEVLDTPLTYSTTRQLVLDSTYAEVIADVEADLAANDRTGYAPP